jgi:hypothetical protein
MLLGKDIREYNVDYWIHIITRGIAVVMHKKREINSVLSFTGAWDNFEKLVKRKKQFEITPDDIMDCFSKHPTHLFNITEIPNPLEYKEFFMEYNRLKSLSRDIVEQELDSPNEVKATPAMKNLRILVGKNYYERLKKENITLTAMGAEDGIHRNTVKTYIETYCQAEGIDFEKDLRSCRDKIN